jgi:uncharacterized membrane protein
MTRAAFLSQLRTGLSGLPQDEIEELVADYDAHFAEGVAEGRSEDEVAAALGSPKRLTRELRAEAGLRRWETNRSPGNYVGAVFALIGLLALDFVILLPFLFLPLLGIVIGVAFTLLAMLVGGIALVTKTLTDGDLAGNVAIARSLASIGLIAGGIGGGALFILILEFILKLLAKYARLHYRLLDTGAREA